MKQSELNRTAWISCDRLDFYCVATAWVCLFIPSLSILQHYMNTCTVLFQSSRPNIKTINCWFNPHIWLMDMREVWISFLFLSHWKMLLFDATFWKIQYHVIKSSWSHFRGGGRSLIKMLFIKVEDIQFSDKGRMFILMPVHHKSINSSFAAQRSTTIFVSDCWQ